MDPDILVLCFVPFGGRKKNGSREVARLLAAENPRIHVEVLQVMWSAVLPENIARIIGDTRWKMILVIGEGYPDAVTVEHTARPAAAFLDESGARPTELTGVPSIMHTNVCWKKGRRRVRRVPTISELGMYPEGLGIIDGVNAGLFVCNRTLFSVLLACEKLRGDGYRPLAGLVHIPPMNDWEKRNRSTRYIAVMAWAIRVIAQRNGVRL